MKTKRKFFRTMTASAVFVAMLVMFTACPSKEPVYVDLGRIPEQYLATVPYRNGDVFRMQHETSKVVIAFEVERHRQKGMNEGFGPVPMRFQPAPDWYYEYETDITKCTPDYPIFNVEIDFSNQYMVNDEEEMPSRAKSAYIYAVGSTQFPLYGEDCTGYEVLDSLEINGRYFHDVFKLKANAGYYESKGSIHAETYFYNYENGLLGITMSNGEKYWLYED